MNGTGPEKIVITGLGMVTPLGNDPAEVLRRVQAPPGAPASCRRVPSLPNAGKDAGAPGAFACPVCARVQDFEPRRYVSEAKLARLMNRDAQLAVAAARLALEDAGVRPGETYAPEEIALFGSTGLAGLPLQEITPLVKLSADPQGAFDLARFGQAGLKAVSPILSFKILSNMPLCFVSINEKLQGPNAIYTPWEGEGARALEAGIRALQAGNARCAVVGGCDVKTHELAFATLQQHGLFDSWTKTGKGLVPGEGAAFLVLETESAALARGAKRYGSLSAFCLRSHCDSDDLVHTRAAVLKALATAQVVGRSVPERREGLGRSNPERLALPDGGPGRTALPGQLQPLNLHEIEALVSCVNGDEGLDEQERAILETAGVSVRTRLCPKKQTGELFAAAALLQVALGAAWIHAGAQADTAPALPGAPASCRRVPENPNAGKDAGAPGVARVLVHCFGYGSTQAAFVLEQV